MKNAFIFQRVQQLNKERKEKYYEKCRFKRVSSQKSKNNR